jgi:hypothetical protein
MAHFKPLPPREWLLENLRYEPDTGLFWWVKASNGRKLSRPAGANRYNGKGAPIAIDIYAQGRACRAHRLAWLFVTGDDPGALTVDHIDRNPLNNRFTNLRLADYRLQLRNRNNFGASAYKGVCFVPSSGKWLARGWENGKRKPRAIAAAMSCIFVRSRQLHW